MFILYFFSNKKFSELKREFFRSLQYCSEKKLDNKFVFVHIWRSV